MSIALRIGLAFLISYLLGSIPASYIAGRLKDGIDLREHGSGNLGATNVFRTLGVWVAIPVLIIDIGKGALAVLIGGLGFLSVETLPDAVPLVCAVAAILGHSFSPFVGFKGGKGVATAAGAFFTLAPWGMVPAAGLWIIMLSTTRIMSVASLSAAAVLPLTLIVYEFSRTDQRHDWINLGAAIVVALLVFFRHRSNILRLREGEEKGLW